MMSQGYCMMLCYDVTGVLYDAMEQPEDAIADFEAILKLRKDVAVAHLNLGLIYLTKMDSYQKYVCTSNLCDL